MTPWRRRQASPEPSATTKLMSDLERLARLEPELKAAEKRERAALIVRGRPIFDWREEIASLKTRGSVHEALDLLMECIAATERQQDLQRQHAPLRAAAHGGLEDDHLPGETPPWWTGRDHPAEARRRRRRTRGAGPLVRPSRGSSSVGGRKTLPARGASACRI